MVTLQGNQVYLRALEKKDLDFLYQLENDTENWEISGTQTPYSKDVLQLYLDNAHLDIYEVKQLRLVICSQDHQSIGLIDLFDFEPYHQRVGLGIIIQDTEMRNKGIGKEAIQLVIEYAFQTLGVKQVYANILEENEPSLNLFEKLGFVAIGIKKDWIRSGKSFKNEILLQKINS
ncbi:MAG: GNAT family N-acetyltransferase [Maribacter sp.]